MVPIEIRNLTSLKDFKSNIKKWEPKECDFKPCEDFIPSLGCLNLF